MTGTDLDRLLERITFYDVLWGALAAITLLLALLVITRWGRSRTLNKALTLSLLLHVWFAAYSTTVNWVGRSFEPVQNEPQFQIERIALEPLGGQTSPAKEPPEPWDAFSARPAIQDASRLHTSYIAA